MSKTFNIKLVINDDGTETCTVLKGEEDKVNLYDNPSFWDTFNYQRALLAAGGNYSITNEDRAENLRESFYFHTSMEGYDYWNQVYIDIFRFGGLDQVARRKLIEYIYMYEEMNNVRHGE